MIKKKTREIVEEIRDSLEDLSATLEDMQNLQYRKMVIMILNCNVARLEIVEERLRNAEIDEHSGTLPG